MRVVSFTLSLSGCTSVCSGEGSPDCQAAEAEDNALLQSKGRNMLPHDDAFNECDSSKPAPPTVGIWDGRFLNEASTKVIVDIGGNVGDDVSLFVQHNPQARIFTFEPMPKVFQQLKGRFADNPNVFAQNFACSDKNGQMELTIDPEGGNGIGATMMDSKVEGEHVQVQLRDVDEILAWVEKETGQVPDLLSMNCEGCEYTVMQRLSDKGWLGKIPNVQLSWHVAGDVKGRVGKRCEFESLLWKTHTRKWKSGFGWVAWQKL